MSTRWTQFAAYGEIRGCAHDAVARNLTRPPSEPRRKLKKAKNRPSVFRSPLHDSDTGPSDLLDGVTELGR